MIELRGVCKRFCSGGREAVVLDGAELQVDSGEIVVLSGPTGAGKTTLVKLLYGAEWADAGAVKVFGHDVRRLRRSSIGLLRRRIGLVPQELRLLEDRTALDNVALALELRSQPARVARIRAADALGRLGMGCAADAPVSILSVGERQRVAIARAIVAEPSMLLLDEPTSHLDAEGALEVANLAREHQSRGVTSLVVTNDPRLLLMARVQEWRQLVLEGGALGVVESFEQPDDRELAKEGSDTESGDPCADGEEGAQPTGERSLQLVDGPGEIPNVVPFPVSARAGGAE